MTPAITVDGNVIAAVPYKIIHKNQQLILLKIEWGSGSNRIFFTAEQYKEFIDYLQHNGKVFKNTGS